MDCDTLRSNKRQVCHPEEWNHDLPRCTIEMSRDTMEELYHRHTSCHYHRTLENSSQCFDTPDPGHIKAQQIQLERANECRFVMHSVYKTHPSPFPLSAFETNEPVKKRPKVSKNSKKVNLSHAPTIPTVPTVPQVPPVVNSKTEPIYIPLPAKVYVPTDLPHVPTAVPHMPTAVPHMPTALPHVPTALPHVPTALPHVIPPFVPDLQSFKSNSQKRKVGSSWKTIGILFLFMVFIYLFVRYVT